MEKNRYTVILEPISKRVNVAENSTVYNAIIALSLQISALCGGKGSCGKCMIRIIDPNAKVSEPSESEIKSLGRDKIEEGYRLACQTKILGDLRIYLTESLIPKGNQILVDGDIASLGIKDNGKLRPIITSKLYTITLSDLDNPKSDLTCLVEGILKGENKFKIFEDELPLHVNDSLYEITKKLPLMIRENNGVITAFFRKYSKKKEIPTSKRWSLFDIEAGKKNDKIFGLAIDIGTTTIVGYLINLISGETASISAMLNPQVSIGEDLISRITYIINHNALDKAKKLVINAVNEILDNCCEKAKISVSNVKDITIVGNTGMHHMFFGVPSEFLAVSPYVPVFKAPINISAGALGLKCNPNVNVYSPPVIAGYVGTDTIGCITSSRIDIFEKYSLLIDIGTNGELVLGNKVGLATGSCAAGSALEGAQISCGMRASEGAIESIHIEKDSLEPSLRVIGETHPIGICGSGLIDIVAEMLKSQIITRAGKFNINLEKVKNHRRIIKRENGYCYIIYKSEWDDQYLQVEPSLKNPIELSISQKDINQLQLAKGAFLSAANLLLILENKKQSELEQVLLAGGFGTYINKENAAFIGLFPEVESKNVFQIGNAAGMGAQLFLKDFEKRNLANEIAYRVKYYEIASSPLFQKEFAFSLYFPHYELDKFPSIKDEYKELPLK